MNKTKAAIWFLILLLAFVYLNNTSLFLKPQGGKPFLLAHRGLAQTFPIEGITGDTNTAEIIYEPEHPYLENTICSMEAAFHAGADMVELDIQLTKDGKFAVFHDAVLEYRTDGVGKVRDYTMEELKKLDIGYGYTADKGKTYPFRDTAISLMPSLEEVMQYFPDQAFLIHIKSNDPLEGKYLAEYLKSIPEERLNQMAVYGGDKPIAILKEELPNLRLMSKATAQKSLIDYLLVGWTGYVPHSMRNTYFHLPQRHARFLWGWPHRFIERMKNVDTIFVLVRGEGQWSEGFDKVNDLKELPTIYSGGIWTNRIDRIAPYIKNNTHRDTTKKPS